MLIWWTCEDDFLNLQGYEENWALPQYLRDQLISRDGRSGRGRLWVDDQFGDVSVDSWPHTPLAKQLGENNPGPSYGGIVIRDRDIAFAVVGIVTDLKLNEVDPGEMDLVPSTELARLRADAEKWLSIESRLRDWCDSAQDKATDGMSTETEDELMFSALAIFGKDTP